MQFYACIYLRILQFYAFQTLTVAWLNPIALMLLHGKIKKRGLAVRLA